MSKTTASTRQIMFSDLSALAPLLNFAEYNCKACLKHKGRTFKNQSKFTLPKDTTFEQSKQYALNNLIDIRDILIQLDLGIKETSSAPEDAAL